MDVIVIIGVAAWLLSKLGKSGDGDKHRNSRIEESWRADSKAYNDLDRTRDIDNKRIEQEKAARNGDNYYGY